MMLFTYCQKWPRVATIHDYLHLDLRAQIKHSISPDTKPLSSKYR